MMLFNGFIALFSCFSNSAVCFTKNTFPFNDNSNQKTTSIFSYALLSKDVVGP